MNAIKRSRNSIVLFSFTGRSKTKKDDTIEQTPAKEIPPLLKSGSSKHFKEPKIGKLDFVPPHIDHGHG